ncbi:MAG: 50S ribosomal protein L25 [Planctomycetota bacterium]|nr:50S ribosomal protein L25 [Planctomycetota bacterium]
MKIIDLPVEKRTKTGSANSRRDRRAGLVPCVLYGGKQESVTLATTDLAMTHVLKAHSALVRLTLGEENAQTALIRELRWSTFGDHIEHIDFMRVEMEDEVSVTVPVHLFGVPVGASEGGQTQAVKTDVELRSRVDSIPSELRLDISGLAIGDGIYVDEIEYPANTRPVRHAHDLIVHVVAPKKVEEEVVVEGEAVEGEAPDEDAPETPSS